MAIGLLKLDLLCHGIVLNISFVTVTSTGSARHLELSADDDVRQQGGADAEQGGAPQSEQTQVSGGVQVTTDPVTQQCRLPGELWVMLVQLQEKVPAAAQTRQQTLDGLTRHHQRHSRPSDEHQNDDEVGHVSLSLEKVSDRQCELQQDQYSVQRGQYQLCRHSRRQLLQTLREALLELRQSLHLGVGFISPVRGGDRRDIHLKRLQTGAQQLAG